MLLASRFHMALLLYATLKTQFESSNGPVQVQGCPAFVLCHVALPPL